MKALAWIISLVVLALIAGAIAIRLKPIDPTVWHVDPWGVDKSNVRFCPEPGSRYAIADPALADLASTIAAEPRTSLLAGTPEEGRMTWVSRSRVFGFPDVTTAAVRDGRLCIVARQVIGGNDWGVNRARLNRWLETTYGIRPDL